jgi:hypothetical protein
VTRQFAINRMIFPPANGRVGARKQAGATGRVKKSHHSSW